MIATKILKYAEMTLTRSLSMMKTIKYKYNATESQKNREGKKKGI